MLQKYRDILDSLSENKVEKPIEERVLLIDSLNTFIRSFVLIKHTNQKGVHIGGLTGFLKSLGFLIKIIQPTRVICVFDGQGSSTNKRYLYPEYKANRNIKRITNWDYFESQEEESEAMTNQILRLIQYLQCVPVDLLVINKVEADDVIGYIAKNIQQKVTIVSSDRDYLQLVDDRITVYSPIKKIFYDAKTVLKEYGIHPNNFLMYKTLLGDTGDNVPGVKGLGTKTIIKLFPQLQTEKKVHLNEILEISAKGKSKTLENIINFKHQLPINEKLMNLHEPNIPEDDLITIHTILDNRNTTFQPKVFSEMYKEDMLGESIQNIDMWLYKTFNELSKQQ